MHIPHTYRKTYSLLILAFLFFSFALSFFLRVDYYDSFDYLHNAMALKQGRIFLGGYNPSRPILMPLINYVLITLFPVPALTRQLLMSVHLLAALISAACTLSVYVIIKKWTNRSIATVTTLFFASNALFVHYSPFGMVDILATLCFMWTIYFLQKSRENQNFLSFAGLFCFALLASACKFYFVFYIPFLFLLILFFSKKIKARFIFVFSALLLLSCFALHLLPLYILKYPSPVKLLFQYLAGQIQYKAPLKESPFEYVYSLISAFNLLGFFLLLAGYLFTFMRRKKKNHVLILTISSSLFFLLQMYQHKESRYLMPVLPLISFFMAQGLWLVWFFVRRLNRKSSRPLRLKKGLLAVVFFSCFITGGFEAMKFRNKVFFVPLQESMARTALQKNTEKKNMLWFNHFYDINFDHPRAKRFSRGDEFMYFFHTSANTMFVLTGLPCRFVDSDFFPETLMPNNPELDIYDKTVAFIAPYNNLKYGEEYPFTMSSLPLIAVFHQEIIKLKKKDILTTDHMKGKISDIYLRRQKEKIFLSLEMPWEYARITLKTGKKITLFLIRKKEEKDISPYLQGKAQEIDMEILTLDISEIRGQKIP